MTAELAGATSPGVPEARSLRPGVTVPGADLHRADLAVRTRSAMEAVHDKWMAEFDATRMAPHPMPEQPETPAPPLSQQHEHVWIETTEMSQAQRSWRCARCPKTRVEATAQALARETAADELVDLLDQALASPRRRHPDVVGNCPWCGRADLFLADGGYITCRTAECRRPTAASEILEDPEHDHVVVLTGTDYTIRHPLRERLDDGLFACDLAASLTALAGPPFRPGTYRVTGTTAPAWTWAEVTA